jgi:hypothetical protein
MKDFKLLVLTILLVSGYSATSQAALVNIELTPSDCLITNCWTLDTTANQSAADIEALTGATNLESLYKENVGDGFDTGSFATSYKTTFDNSPLDPEDALIELISGMDPITCGVCFLLVKDGDQSPAQYIFDLSAAGMINSISLKGFWPDQGAISHIEILGTSISEVPVPAAIWLFGTALIGFAGMARRTKV